MTWVFPFTSFILKGLFWSHIEKGTPICRVLIQRSSKPDELYLASEYFDSIGQEGFELLNQSIESLKSILSGNQMGGVQDTTKPLIVRAMSVREPSLKQMNRDGYNYMYL